MKKKTEEALLQLATKIGTNVEHLYGVLTKQAKVWAFKAIVECVIWVIAFTVLVAISCCQDYVPCVSQTDIVSAPTLLLILSWAFTTVIGLIIICNASDKISDIYQAFTNPEYWAIERILEIF